MRQLLKEMKTTQARPYEVGKIEAPGFQSPEEDAQYIARPCLALRCLPVRERDADRGVSWLDMAVLLRSVRRDGEPISGWHPKHPIAPSIRLGRPAPTFTAPPSASSRSKTCSANSWR